MAHLPWLGISPQLGGIAVLVAWFIACIGGARVSRRCDGRDWARWAGIGAVAALSGLPILGTRAEHAASTLGASEAPQKVLMALGFLLVGVAMGLLGGMVARVTPRCHWSRPRDWLSAFAWAAVAAAAPLIMIGGLVTSTRSGMAVPDWPTTYGSNMFLYPLGAGTKPDIFFEHSHRLFGTLLGMTTLTLAIWTLLRGPSRGTKVFALVVLGLVILQGVLGGVRVLQGSADPGRDERLFKIIHGVLAQLTLGSIVALACVLSPTFRTEPDPGSISLPRARLLRVAMNGALHGSIFQLLLGAIYRHLRHQHVLYTHIAFSIVVLVMAMLAGAAASATQGDARLARMLRRCGVWMMGVGIAQFALGWVVFLIGGSDAAASGPLQAVLRTAHQANGACLLGLAVATFVWGKRALRASRDQ